MASRTELVGGVSHTQCVTCGAFCRSHAHHLLHLASSHPTLLNSAPAGRLGLVFLYQRSGKLFHCNICLYTHREFNQVWKHLLRTHCIDPDPAKDHDPGTKPGLNQDQETKPRLEQDQGTKPALNQEQEMKSGVEQNQETNPGLNQNTENKSGPEQDQETKLGREEDQRTGLDCADVEMTGVEKEKTRDGGEEGAEPVVAMETEEHTDKSLQKSSADPAPSSLLSCEAALYRCSVCSFSHKLRAIVVNHVVRKHDSPRPLYDLPDPKADKPETAAADTSPAPAEEEEEVTSETMRQELEATKYLRFSGHFVFCELCDWKTKVKRGTRGFAQSHLERCHDLKKSFECSICGQAFFMSYRLKEHMKINHRPGRYHCLFCSFRSDNLTGFRRHSGKCNYKDQDEDRDEDQDQIQTRTRTRPDPDEEQERILRPKRHSSRVILEEEEDDDED